MYAEGTHSVRIPPLTPMTTMHFLFLNFIDPELKAKFVGKETFNTSMATKLIWAGLVLGGVLLHVLAFSAEKDMQWGQPSLTDELAVLFTSKENSIFARRRHLVRFTQAATEFPGG